MSERLVVIGLCGVARAGKDTVARILESQVGFTRIGLADGVRAMLDDLDGQTWEFRKDRGEAGLTDRWAMQTGGTECRVDVGSPMLYVDLALIKIRYASHYHPRPRRRFVISDIRYPHEPERLGAQVKAWEGFYETWRVSRPGGPVIAESTHSSETSLAGIAADITVHNDGTKVKLATDVVSYIEPWFSSPNGKPTEV